MSISIDIDDSPRADVLQHNRSETLSPRRVLNFDDSNNKSVLDFGTSSSNRGSTPAKRLQHDEAGSSTPRNGRGRGASDATAVEENEGTAITGTHRIDPKGGKKTKKRKGVKSASPARLERFLHETTASRRAYLAKEHPTSGSEDEAGGANSPSKKSKKKSGGPDKGLLTGKRLYESALQMKASLEAAKASKEAAEAKEISKYPFRPTLSRYSQEIVELSLYKPPSDRFGPFERLLNDQKRLSRDHERYSAEEAELQQCTFRPSINSLSRRMVDESRVSQWVHHISARTSGDADVTWIDPYPTTEEKSGKAASWRDGESVGSAAVSGDIFHRGESQASKDAKAFVRGGSTSAPIAKKDSAANNKGGGRADEDHAVDRPRSHGAVLSRTSSTASRPPSRDHIARSSSANDMSPEARRMRQRQQLRVSPPRPFHFDPFQRLYGDGEARNRRLAELRDELVAQRHESMVGAGRVPIDRAVGHAERLREWGKRRDETIKAMRTECLSSMHGGAAASRLGAEAEARLLQRLGLGDSVSSSTRVTTATASDNVFARSSTIHDIRNAALDNDTTAFSSDLIASSRERGFRGAASSSNTTTGDTNAPPLRNLLDAGGASSSTSAPPMTHASEQTRGISGSSGSHIKGQEGNAIEEERSGSFRAHSSLGVLRSSSLNRSAAENAGTAAPRRAASAREGRSAALHENKYEEQSSHRPHISAVSAHLAEVAKHTRYARTYSYFVRPTTVGGAVGGGEGGGFYHQQHNESTDHASFKPSQHLTPEEREALDDEAFAGIDISVGEIRGLVRNLYTKANGILAVFARDNDTKRYTFEAFSKAIALFEHQYGPQTWARGGECFGDRVVTYRKPSIPSFPFAPQLSTQSQRLVSEMRQQDHHHHPSSSVEREHDGGYNGGARSGPLPGGGGYYHRHMQHHQQHVHHDNQSRSKSGGGSGRRGSTSGGASGAHDRLYALGTAKMRQRARSAERNAAERANPPLDPECTFKPLISNKSRVISDRQLISMAIEGIKNEDSERRGGGGGGVVPAVRSSVTVGSSGSNGRRVVRGRGGGGVGSAGGGRRSPSPVSPVDSGESSSPAKRRADSLPTVQHSHRHQGATTTAGNGTSSPTNYSPHSPRGVSRSTRAGSADVLLGGVSPLSDVLHNSRSSSRPLVEEEEGDGRNGRTGRSGPHMSRHAIGDDSHVTIHPYSYDHDRYAYTEDSTAGTRILHDTSYAAAAAKIEDEDAGSVPAGLNITATNTTRAVSSSSVPILSGSAFSPTGKANSGANASPLKPRRIVGGGGGGGVEAATSQTLRPPLAASSSLSLTGNTPLSPSGKPRAEDGRRNVERRGYDDKHQAVPPSSSSSAHAASSLFYPSPTTTATSSPYYSSNDILNQIENALTGHSGGGSVGLRERGRDHDESNRRAVGGPSLSTSAAASDLSTIASSTHSPHQGSLLLLSGAGNKVGGTNTGATYQSDRLVEMRGEYQSGSRFGMSHFSAGGGASADTFRTADSPYSSHYHRPLSPSTEALVEEMANAMALGLYRASSLNSSSAGGAVSPNKITKNKFGNTTAATRGFPVSAGAVRR